MFREGGPVQCPKCTTEIRGGARFCGACGAEQSPSCPSCGHPVSRTATFCGRCGIALRAAGKDIPPEEWAPTEPVGPTTPELIPTEPVPVPPSPHPPGPA